MTQPKVHAQRKKLALASLSRRRLCASWSEANSKRICATCAVSLLAGEARSHDPASLSPVIGAVLQVVNDRMPDSGARKTVLLPILDAMVGTRATRRVEVRRCYMVVNYVCRIAVPMGLEATKRPDLCEWATRFRALPEISDKTSAQVAATSYESAYWLAGAPACDDDPRTQQREAGFHVVHTLGLALGAARHVSAKPAAAAAAATWAAYEIHGACDVASDTAGDRAMLWDASAELLLRMAAAKSRTGSKLWWSPRVAEPSC